MQQTPGSSQKGLVRGNPAAIEQLLHKSHVGAVRCQQSSAKTTAILLGCLAHDWFVRSTHESSQCYCCWQNNEPFAEVLGERKENIYVYMHTERERGMYGNSTAARMAPGHLILYDPKAPAEAATTCAPTCIF